MRRFAIYCHSTSDSQRGRSPSNRFTDDQMSLFTVSQTWYYFSKTLKCPFWKYNANTTQLYMKAFGRFCPVIKFKLIAVAVILRCEKTTLGPCSDARVWNTTYFKSIYMNRISLTHWGRDKMDATSQTTLSNAFSWMKMLEFRLKIHWSLFPRVQLTIFQHWFR